MKTKCTRLVANKYLIHADKAEFTLFKDYYFASISELISLQSHKEVSSELFPNHVCKICADFLVEDILSEKVIKIAVNFVGSPINENFAADVNRDQFVVPLIKRSELQR